MWVISIHLFCRTFYDDEAMKSKIPVLRCEKTCFEYNKYFPNRNGHMTKKNHFFCLRHRNTFSNFQTEQYNSVLEIFNCYWK
jgi:hypothetical protein